MTETDLLYTGVVAVLWGLFCAGNFWYVHNEECWMGHSKLYYLVLIISGPIPMLVLSFYALVAIMEEPWHDIKQMWMRHNHPIA